MKINDTIREYSMNPEALERIMEGVKLEVTWLRSESTAEFPQYHDVWKIKVTRGGKQMTFDYHNSNINLGMEPDLYAILCTIWCESNVPADFAEFCRGYGYDADSGKTKKLFERCVTFSNKIHKLFTDEELAVFPN